MAQFRKRESEELVLAYGGPVGSGVDLVIEETRKVLEAADYDVVFLKLSDYIRKLYRGHHFTNIDLNALTKSNRYERLQDAGNELRKHYRQQDLLAQLAIGKIITVRTEDQPGEIREIVPRRRAYLIDQLKRPEEVLLLRTVYGKLFFLIGVLCTHEQRKKRLTDAGLTSPEAEKIMQRDEKQNFEHGQQLAKTLELADYFIRNNHSNRDELSRQLQRFIDLVHGRNGITPTQHEYAMYVAHAAGAGSACLSRQVGAAITDPNGTIISTGCNDVPKYGGGLYNSADGARDVRCIRKEGGRCFNDYHKQKLRDRIEEIVTQSGLVKEEVAEQLSTRIYSETRLKDIIEYSRSIHAEMDAITSIARTGGVPLKGSFLYATTFPCHNCARHIVAVGIERVYYIQPYEKSLASDLHDDAIQLDPSEVDAKPEKVKFLHFEGVSPRKYLAFFEARSERKRDGKAVEVVVRAAPKIDPEHLDPYVDFEAKVTEHLEGRLKIDLADVLSS